jgi:hypothetical protein
MTAAGSSAAAETAAANRTIIVQQLFVGVMRSETLRLSRG